MNWFTLKKPFGRPVVGHQGHVRQLGLLVVAPREPPDHQEGIADVTVRSPVEVIDTAVDDLSNLIHLKAQESEEISRTFLDFPRFFLTFLSFLKSSKRFRRHFKDVWAPSEEHHLLLKDLRRFHEVSNVAEANDGVHLTSPTDWVIDSIIFPYHFSSFPMGTSLEDGHT